MSKIKKGCLFLTHILAPQSGASQQTQTCTPLQVNSNHYLLSRKLTPSTKFLQPSSITPLVFSDHLPLFLIGVISTIVFLLLDASGAPFLANWQLHCSKGSVHVNVPFDGITSAFSSNHVPEGRT